VQYLEPLIGRIQLQIGYRIHYWRTDGAKKFLSELFQKLMEKNNIKHEKGTPYAHYYLGPVERPMLVIANEIRTLLIDTHLLEELWVKLVKTVVYLRNRSLTKTLDQLTPYECLYKKKPDVSHLRIIDSAVYCANVDSLNTEREQFNSVFGTRPIDRLKR
jgi:hypothetical protein